MGTYVELGVTLGGLLEVGLLHLGGTVEAARRSTEDGLTGKSPAGSHSSNRGHFERLSRALLSQGNGRVEYREKNRDLRMMLPAHHQVTSRWPVGDWWC